MSAFRRTQKVLFKHCDPAGLVFYPRYFEMINDTVEAFFETALDWPFHWLHSAGGVPTVEIQASFPAPSRHGDVLEIALRVLRVGRTSLTLAQDAQASGQARFAARSTLVLTGADGRPRPWPDPIRARLDTLTEPRT